MPHAKSEYKWDRPPTLEETREKHHRRVRRAFAYLELPADWALYAFDRIASVRFLVQATAAISVIVPVIVGIEAFVEGSAAREEERILRAWQVIGHGAETDQNVGQRDAIAFLRERGRHKYFYGVEMANADLRHLDLSGADLTNAKLTAADLSGTDLGGARLHGANLSGANLSNANLSKTNLRGANLKGASLYGASLYGANLDRANLSSANLWDANLSGAYLVDADLNTANLRHANLSGAHLISANLSGAVLASTNLRGASLLGANLHRAGLHDADLTDAELSHVDLTVARLSGANLSGVDLSKVRNIHPFQLLSICWERGLSPPKLSREQKESLSGARCSANASFGLFCSARPGLTSACLIAKWK